MSSQIHTKLVRDNILMCRDEVAFAVEKGGQSISSQRFISTSASSSVHNYTVQVPSHSVVMSRELLWHGKFKINLTGTSRKANARLVHLGQGAFISLPPAAAYPAAGFPSVELHPASDTCLAPFPLHQFVENMSVQINNTTTSINTSQVLDPLLRNMNREDLARWNSTTPTQLDNYGNYNEFDQNGNFKANSPFNGYDYTFGNQIPRGAFRLVLLEGNALSTADNQAMNASLTFEVAEPIMLSPFVFGDVSHSQAGIYGVSQINLTMMMDSLARRAIRFLDPALSINYTAKSVASVDWIASDCYIECRFLTPPPSVLLPELNVVPYQQINNFNKIQAGVLLDGATTEIQSDNIQLNCIPDKVIICARLTKDQRTSTRADSYLTINNININFNNQSGILSSATPQELWRMSYEAGSNQSFEEFKGKTFAIAPNSAGFGYSTTTGSCLVLNFGEHINITEDYYAPSSVGQFNFSVKVNATNNLQGATGAGGVELVVIFVNSGVFSTQNGVSSAYVGVLTKQQVLDASLQEPISHEQVSRYVGGGFLDSLKSGLSSLLPVFKMARPLIGMIPHPAAKAVDSGLRAVGLGQTGGAMTAGAETGGGRRMLKHLA
jgi:hypothetical protein